MEHEILLTTLTYGGEAMGRLDDGRAVFTPFGLPGERVRVRLTEEKRNFARGRSSDFSTRRLNALCRAVSISAYAAGVITSICPMQSN